METPIAKAAITGFNNRSTRSILKRRLEIYTYCITEKQKIDTNVAMLAPMKPNLGMRIRFSDILINITIMLIRRSIFW